jgi:hypothetical protein
MTKAVVAFFTFLLVVIGLGSCTKSPNEGIPAYLVIDSVKFTANAGQGSGLQFIPNVWLESEGENIGVYELPVNAPALVSGSKQVIVNAGVYVSSDFFNREIYPAFQPYKTTVNFIPGQAVSIIPEFEYYDECVFPINEDFENGNIFGSLVRTSIGDTNNLEGRALQLTVNGANPSIRGVTTSSVAIPGLKKVYLEMHFKGDIDFAIGVEGVLNGNVNQIAYIDQFFPNSNWYKVYYDISDLVYSLDANTYNLFIEVLKLSNVDESNLYFDNIKIVVI